MTFQGVDYFNIDDLLTDEERLIRRTVRAFVEEQVLGSIAQHFRSGTFPVELVPEMGRLGLLGMTLQGYGCAGLGPVAYGLACQELERADSGIRSFCSVQSSLVMYTIHRYGSEAQKHRWLPALATGKAIGCFALTEPDFGSNPAGMRTEARLVGQRYRLHGVKRWITNGSIADVAVVWAKCDGDIRGFLISRDTPGYTTRDIPGKISLRASVTSELFFDDCEVAEVAVLPEAQGLRAPLSALNEARYGIAWGMVGAMMACYQEALEYAQSRVQFSRPIAAYQLIQDKLVTMLQELTKAQLLCWQLGRLKQGGKLRPEQVSLTKRNNVAWARDVARMAREILGANGVTDDYQAGRHMCNLESVYTYEGTHEIHTLAVGRDITGHTAFDG